MSAITFSLPTAGGPPVRRLWGTLELWVIQPMELDALPDGTALVCIDGTIAIKGQDGIDGDTRYGCLAYGFLKVKE